jgi:hypothetical protein
MKRWTKGANNLINVKNTNTSSQRDQTSIIAYVTVIECCKRMVNAALRCRHPEYLRSIIEMVDKHTIVGRGDDSTTPHIQIYGTLGNPPRVRRKDGVASSPSQNRILRLHGKDMSVTFVDQRVITEHHVVLGWKDMLLDDKPNLLSHMVLMTKTLLKKIMIAPLIWYVPKVFICH